jgi:hypothetical protein
MDYPWVEKNTHAHTRLGSGQVHVHTRVKNRTHARPSGTRYPNYHP